MFRSIKFEFVAVDANYTGDTGSTRNGMTLYGTMLIPQTYINGTCDAYHGVAMALHDRACAGLRHRRDVAYGPHHEQRLDLFFPPDAVRAPLPIYLNIHGGGWTHGYKEWMSLNAPVVTAFPAIYATLGYRLAPEARHPAQLHDVLAAIDWLAREAAAFGGDPANIHIGGHSAGGHLAALASLRTDLHESAGIGPGLIRSCFAYSGLYDLRGAHSRPVVPGLSAVPMLANSDAEEEASPLCAMRRVPTVFHISWGAHESDDFKRGGRAFADALRKTGNEVITAEPDLDHFWIHLDQMRPESGWNIALRRRMTGTAEPERQR
jgi:acetyl esterase/lipase